MKKEIASLILTFLMFSGISEELSDIQGTYPPPIHVPSVYITEMCPCTLDYIDYINKCKKGVYGYHLFNLGGDKFVRYYKTHDFREILTDACAWAECEKPKTRKEQKMLVNNFISYTYYFQNLCFNSDNEYLLDWWQYSY